MSWEFEDLFDVGAEPEAGLLDSYWREQPTEIRVGRMGYRTRTIKAGPRLEVEIYPIFGRENTGRLRAAKKNMTPEAVQRNNEERSRRKLIQLYAALPFLQGDHVFWRQYLARLAHQHRNLPVARLYAAAVPHEQRRHHHKHNDYEQRLLHFASISNLEINREKSTHIIPRMIPITNVLIKLLLPNVAAGLYYGNFSSGIYKLQEFFQ